MSVPVVLVAAALLGSVLPGGVAQAKGDPGRDQGVAVSTVRGGGACSQENRPGGDWPSLNGGFDNSRHQRQEQRLDAMAARRLAPAWTFDIGSVGAPGAFRSTPIVAAGCVYVASGEGYLGARGDVVALNADTGELVWHATLDGSLLGLAVANGLVYATPSRGTRGEVETPTVTDAYQPAGSYAVALDARSGALRWVSDRLDDGNATNGTFVNASPVVIPDRGRSVVFVPLAGGGGDGARVPMYFLDGHSGRTIRRALSLTDAEYKEGFGGTGIWSTAAYDPGTGHLYAGTADSDGKTKQHPYNNAVLKIDADPTRGTFSAVVGVYEGISERADIDRTVPGFGDSALCSGTGIPSPVRPPTFFDTSAAPECLELDFDFGASPQLHTGADGLLKVAALQKAGVLHDIDTASMEREWAVVLGPGGAANNSATGAVGDRGLHVGATPNLLYEVDPADGARTWVSTTGADAFAYQPLTAANGVLYTLTDMGHLVAADAASGAVILHRAVGTDLGRDVTGCLGAGAGVTVARGTVYVPCDGGGLDDVAGLPGSPGALVAYR